MTKTDPAIAFGNSHFMIAWRDALEEAVHLVGGRVGRHPHADPAAGADDHQVCVVGERHAGG